MKKSFSELPRPLIVGSLRHKTADSVIDDIKKSESDGAKAFILQIQLMNEKYHDFESLREIAESTECPIMALNYRTDNGFNDEQRIEVMREAVQAGFRSVDIPMYIYDNDTRNSLKLSELSFASANPNEVSMRPEVVVKQKELIKEFQDMGAEVLMSAHVGVELSREQIVSLALEIQSRGADIVKIISSCESQEQQTEILRTNLELKNTLDVPFLYTCFGTYNRFIRFNAPLFGSMLVFGYHEYGELSNKEKPLLKDLTEFYEIMKVEIDNENS
jgi:3-dehydroquinate dehydratase